MKKQDLLNVGVREDCVETAMAAVKVAGKAGRFRGVVPRALVKDIAKDPVVFLNDEHFAELARKLLVAPVPVQQDPINYSRWGDNIDQATLDQMTDACSLPVSVAAALMPDGHVGYGLPIGGVLATENAVIPYAVGVDIACRVRMSVLDVPVKDLYKELKGEGVRRGDRFSESLENGTRFGIGANWNLKHDHSVMDADWSVTPVTKAMKDRAWSQLGTSGSGNHFVEYGVLTVNAKNELGLEPGEYVALLSHSGSRGAGAAVCKEYSRRADAKMDKRFQGRLSWLMLDTEDGQQYWNAMNLMGEYAAANHAVIHKAVTELLGVKIIAGVENHHNYCIPDTELVQTINGPKRMSEIRSGDFVYAYSEKDNDLVETKVIDVWHSGKKAIHTVKTKHRMIRASAGHPVLVIRKDKTEWLKMSDVKKGDKLVCAERCHSWNRVFTENVISVTVSEDEEDVYDLSVEHESHSFVCSGVVVHNCWREAHDGRDLYVHRKGATPAGKGVLGIIPGSMASPCFVVVGKGNPASLDSAAHGAGRRMSRTEAKKKFNWPEWKSVLKQRGVRLLSAGLDEVPGAYKDIGVVMAEQSDLVDIVAQFDPKIVKMSDDGRSED